MVLNLLIVTHDSAHRLSEKRGCAGRDFAHRMGRKPSCAIMSSSDGQIGSSGGNKVADQVDINARVLALRFVRFLDAIELGRLSAFNGRGAAVTR